MNNLDTLTVPMHAYGDVAIANPVNAWPGAAETVIVWMTVIGNDLIQFGCDAPAGPTIWQRKRNFVTGGPWTVWSGGHSNSGELGLAAQFADGAQKVALPDYAKLAFTSANGPYGALENGDLRVSLSGLITVEFRVTVTHKQNSNIIFGVGKNGSQPTELARFLDTSSAPITEIVRRDTVLEENSLVAFYVSSDFDQQEMSWSDGEVLLVRPG